MTRDTRMQAHFTNLCYPDKAATYDDPGHPRHNFTEDWDSAAHPRFDLGRIQTSFERLFAKEYTVHLEPHLLRILNAQGEVIFEMKLLQCPL